MPWSGSTVTGAQFVCFDSLEYRSDTFKPVILGSVRQVLDPPLVEAITSTRLLATRVALGVRLSRTDCQR
jgi:hypothetical protein